MSIGYYGPRFACSCQRNLAPEYVEGILQNGSGEGMFGRVIVQYRCVCIPDQVLTMTFPAVAGAIKALIGDETLPWRNPTPLVPIADDHPDMVAWRWLLDKYKTVDEFIEELERP